MVGSMQLILTNIIAEKILCKKASDDIILTTFQVIKWKIVNIKLYQFFGWMFINIHNSHSLISPSSTVHNPVLHIMIIYWEKKYYYLLSLFNQ